MTVLGGGVLGLPGAGGYREHDILVITPEGRTSFYINSADGRERYSDFFVREFIPYVEKEYRVQPGKRGRAIAGISMGGYGALRFAFAVVTHLSGRGEKHVAVEDFAGLAKNQPVTASTRMRLRRHGPRRSWSMARVISPWLWKYGERAFRYCQQDVGHALGTMRFAMNGHAGPVVGAAFRTAQAELAATRGPILNQGPHQIDIVAAYRKIHAIPS